MSNERRSQQALTGEVVMETMALWAVFFKDRRPTEDEIKILVEYWFRTLVEKRVTEDEFNRAAKLINERNHFFPVLADILEAVESVRALQPRPARLADIMWKLNFPETCTKEEARLLGLTDAEVERARRENLPDNHPMKQHLRLIGNGGKKGQ